MSAAAVDRAIRACGGLTALAKAIGISPQAVFKWRRNGVPAERVLAVERATGGLVSRHELRPDLYPVADTARELPAARRA